LDVAYPDIRQWLEATALPDFDVTDLWWNPGESGWGMNLTQHPSGQCSVWVHLCADSGPLWLVMTAVPGDSRTFTALSTAPAGRPTPSTFDPAG